MLSSLLSSLSRKKAVRGISTVRAALLRTACCAEAFNNGSWQGAHNPAQNALILCRDPVRELTSRASNFAGHRTRCAHACGAYIAA